MALVFDAHRARAADLLSLPASIPGTNCRNCQFYRPEHKANDPNVGYCSHYRLLMNVMGHWCCSFWGRSDAPLASPALARRRFARRLLTRLARFAKAGAPDDCGHEREGDPSGGLFAPGNTCATGGGSDRGLAPLDPHPDPEDNEWEADDEGEWDLDDGGEWEADDEYWDPGDEPEEEKDMWERMKERKAEREREEQQAKQADPATQKREDAAHKPPPPTVSSPHPFEPGKPIGDRIAAYRKANPELLNRIISAMPPLQKEVQAATADRGKVIAKLRSHKAKIMYMEKMGTMPQTEEGKARLADELNKVLAENDVVMDRINAARQKMSEVIDPLTGRRGDKGVRFKTIDGTGKWNGENGRRRDDALGWLNTKIAGSGEVEIQWNHNNSNVLSSAWASTGRSNASIGVGPLSDVNTYIHEAAHVLELRVAGVLKASQEFLEYRTADYDDYPMNEFMDDEDDKRYGDDEIGNEDDFRAAFGKTGCYVGKKYRTGSKITEIVSMGLEKLYLDPVTFARKDPEYCTFVLGLLSGDLRNP